MSTKPEPKKTKGMCIATRCTSVEQFIQMFHRFVDEESFFVSTLNTRPPGLETSFSVQLVDGTPVLRGMCVVMQAWTDANNPFKTPGVRLGIKRLTANSMVVFEQLLITRSGAKPGAVPGGTPQQVTPVATKPMAGATPKQVTPVTTKPFGAPKLKPPAVIAVGVPKSLPPKSPLTETAPTKSAPSRVEISKPARPSTDPAAPRPAEVVARSVEPALLARPPQPPARAASEPIPEPIGAEPTDVTEEKTDVREPRMPVAELGVPARPDIAPPSIAAKLAEAGKVIEAKPAEAPSPAVVEAVRQEMAAELDLAKPGDATDDARTPGSELVLPANPLMNLTDESLEGYVDCTLYEETGNFFPVDDDSDFVDDVVPPPVLAQRQRTITPLPAAPDAQAASGFDTNPDAALAAKGVESAAAGYGGSANDGLARRESSPSLVVPPAMPPPPMPRESVMVDPSLIARGSTPAFEPESRPAVDTPSFSKNGAAKPSFDADALPLPASSTQDRLVPTPHKRPRWWLLGGLVGLLSAAAIVVVFMTSKSDGSNQAPPTKPATKQAAQIAPPTADPKPSENPTGVPGDDEFPEDEPPGAGPPMVGEGPCKVVVATTPAGSMVAIDGKTVGPSPLTVGASCGPHKLDIAHARYAPTSKTITLAEGKEHKLDVTLQRPTHTVTVTSNPSGAQIFIDGRSAGTTPTKLNVLGFVTLKLEFKKTGYQPTQAKLYSRYAQDNVTVRLNKW